MQRKSPTTIISLTLAPINIDSTTQLVMDSFHCENKDAARSLAELAHLKTAGNPFFLGQFLKSMAQEKLIHFNYSTHEWEWEISKMQFVEYPILFSFIFYFTFFLMIYIFNKVYFILFYFF